MNYGKLVGKEILYVVEEGLLFGGPEFLKIKFTDGSSLKIDANPNMDGGAAFLSIELDDKETVKEVEK